MSAVRDVVVVGGGLAGAAFAIQLAAAGRDVVLVEREAGPHDKVCGEFLSGEAARYLAALGIDLAGLGTVPIDRVRLSRGPVSSSRALPFPALSLSRRVLDEAVLDRTARAGAELRRGASVRGLTRDGELWRARLDDGSEIAAHAAALATGKHDLRGFPRPPGEQNDLIGLKMHFFSARAAGDGGGAIAADGDAGIVDIGLFPGGYAGLERIEGGLLNLCLLVRQANFAAHGRDWREAVLDAVRGSSRHIADRLGEAKPLHEQPLAIARIPYGMVRDRVDDGVWRLGDQAAVIPSFSGEGMSIALHSARLAAAAFLGGETAAAFQRRLASDVRAQVRLATGVSKALVQAPAQIAAVRTARAFPAALSAMGAATRISEKALTAAA